MLLEARGDASGMFELVEEALNEIALPIQKLAVAARHPTAAGRRNAGANAPLAQERAEPVGIIGLVGDQPAVGWHHVEQGSGGAEIVRLAGAQGQADRQAASVDHGMDFGRQAATRPADRLVPVFLGAAAC